jgi:hypothetical protein
MCGQGTAALQGASAGLFIGEALQHIMPNLSIGFLFFFFLRNPESWPDVF